MKKLSLILICAALAILSCFSLIGCGGRTVTVTFDGNGGTPARTEVVAVVGATLPGVEAPTRDGYTFTGWYRSAGASEGDRWKVTDKVESAITLYAGWTSESYITVRFELSLSAGENVDNAPQDVKLKSGSLVLEPTDPVRAGYIFKGWYADSGLSEKFDFAADTVTADTTLYAKWAKLYTVTLKTPNGSDDFLIEEGKTLAEVSVPTDKSKMFIGLYDSASFAKKLEFSDPVTKNMTVYAKYVTPTATSKYNLRVEKYDYNNDGVAYISTKEPLDTLVIPSKVGDVNITEVRVENSYYDDDLQTDVFPELRVGTLIFPASVTNVDVYVDNDRIVVGAYDVEYTQNGYYASYDGCLYTKGNYSSGNNSYTTRVLSRIPSKTTPVINIMPGAYFSPIDFQAGYVYRVQSDVTERMKDNGLNVNSYYKTPIIVPDEFYQKYRTTDGIGTNNKIALYRESMFDAENDRIFNEKTGTLYLYFGDKGFSEDDPITVGIDDDVKIIADDAFFGYNYITISNGVTKIEGSINTKSSGDMRRLTILCGAEVFADVDFYDIFGQSNKDYCSIYIPEANWQDFKANTNIVEYRLWRYTCYVVTSTGPVNSVEYDTTHGGL